MDDNRPFIIKGIVEGDQDGKPIHRLIEVPEGKWALTIATGHLCAEEWDEFHEVGYTETTDDGYVIIGETKPTKYMIVRNGGRRHDHGFSSSWSTSESTFTADEPFGAILTTRENGVLSRHASFVAARQIHKGELGQYPAFPSPTYAREARDLQHHHARWARLIDIAELINMSPQDLVNRFYPFADTNGRGLPVLFVVSRDDIHGKIIPSEAVEQIYDTEFARLFDRDPATIWVRQGFANTVICLHHLGYQPHMVFGNP
ncbi:MAG: hypothetical protein WCK01_03930 [Candidatus Uhrbacteria bacterium]